jgi:hypothetical protein
MFNTGADKACIAALQRALKDVQNILIGQIANTMDILS